MITLRHAIIDGEDVFDEKAFVEIDSTFSVALASMRRVELRMFGGKCGLIDNVRAGLRIEWGCAIVLIDRQIIDSTTMEVSINGGVETLAVVLATDLALDELDGLGEPWSKWRAR